MIPRNKLKLRLNILFLAMTAVVLFSASLVFYTQHIQSSYTAKITLSTRQKAIAEELARKVVMLKDKSATSPDIAIDIQDLRTILEKWENAQKALLNGSDYYGTEAANSNDVQALLQGNSTFFVAARDQLDEFSNDPFVFDESKLKLTLNNMSLYVEGMNNVTGKYLWESEIYRSVISGLFWFAVILSVLLLLGGLFFVLRPIRVNFDGTKLELEEMVGELSKAEKTKTDFLANMSHEVRTPLNGVIGMTEILAQTKLDEEQRGYVRNIHSSANNLLELLNNVLDVSKIQSGKLELHKERFVLSDCIEQVIDLMKPLAQAKKLELMSDIDPGMPLEILQDETRLRQVLINLVNNAIKFTENGEVLIHVELINKESDFVQIKFSIRDTGIGIDPSQTEKIFQSFYQTDSSINKRYAGSGLGLSICKNLVQEMNGRIWVESKPGAGSIFSFTIVAETSGSSQNAKISALNGLRALIVDDNKTNLKILVKQLSTWGIQATPFNSPELVTEIVSNLHKFDFVIMDMQMPEMDGRVLTEKIRSIHSAKELPIIVLSSVGEHLMTDKDNFYNAYLTKPVRQSRLLDTIIEVLHISPVQIAKQKMLTGNFEVSGQKSNIKVLVAHDNELSRAVTAKTLQLLGHKFETVSTGKEVLERSRRDDYDLIIMDVKMNEMDGCETTRQLKKMVGRNAMPVIIGLTENELMDKQQCMQAGMDDLVEKPMRPEVLQEKIHYWLESE
jgi:signal transduction histidine kinase/DNA-binding response OmpR family regulator